MKIQIVNDAGHVLASYEVKPGEVDAELASWNLVNWLYERLRAAAAEQGAHS